MFDRADNKTPILLTVMAINFALMGVDVLISHSQNNFFRFELIPIIYAPLAILLILARLILARYTWPRQVFQTIMWLGIVIGLLGTYFHLSGNATSNQEPLFRLLVTGSPIAAPIAFAGVSAFSLAADAFRENKRKICLLELTGLGFLAATIAAFLDHARLGFIPVYTIIPLATGILAALNCFWRATTPTNKEQFTLFLLAMGINLFAGLLGFGFHLLGDLAGTQEIVLSRFLYRDPLLGPLLFCNLALLGMLSIIPEHTSLKHLVGPKPYARENSRQVI